MDVTGIAQLSTSIAETGTRQAVDIAILKKTQDIATATATALIQGLPDMPSLQRLPAHLGNTINTTA